MPILCYDKMYFSAMTVEVIEQFSCRKSPVLLTGECDHTQLARGNASSQLVMRPITAVSCSMGVTMRLNLTNNSPLLRL